MLQITFLVLISVEVSMGYYRWLDYIYTKTPSIAAKTCQPNETTITTTTSIISIISTYQYKNISSWLSIFGKYMH
jgi:hypothetical protein